MCGLDIRFKRHDTVCFDRTSISVKTCYRIISYFDIFSKTCDTILVHYNIPLQLLYRSDLMNIL